MKEELYKEIMRKAQKGNSELPTEQYTLNPEDILIVDGKKVLYKNFKKMYK
jgi:hypothetical protein